MTPYSRAVNQLDRRRHVLALALAGLAGFVDAVGFVSADRYFVSFMSGNTTRLAVDLIVNPASAAIPAILIACFVAGVAIGAFVSARMPVMRKPAIGALVCALLVLAATVDPELQMTRLVTLVLAMGALNNTFRREGEAAVGLTYMTGALVRLGQTIGDMAAGKPTEGASRYAALWLSLFVGAVAGAALEMRADVPALWIAAIWAAGCTTAAWRVVRMGSR